MVLLITAVRLRMRGLGHLGRRSPSHNVGGTTAADVGRARARTALDTIVTTSITDPRMEKPHPHRG